MNEAHVFQHIYTRVQIFVYHCSSIEEARNQFELLVNDSPNWNYLCKKIAT
jgi:hypothetical protein